MALDETTVAHIAKLARIRLDGDETQRYAEELSTIFDWIEQLNEVDTGEAEAVASVTTHHLPMRDDVVTDGHKSADILANAPSAEYDCFAVPKVIDQG